MYDDFKKLKNLRVAQNGIISKQTNYIPTLSGSSFEKLDSTNLHYHAQQVDFNIPVFDILAERIEDIVEQSVLECDESNVDEQRQINGLTLVTYAHKIGGTRCLEASDGIDE